MSRITEAAFERAVRHGRRLSVGTHESAYRVARDLARDALANFPLDLLAVEECREDQRFAVTSVLGSGAATGELLPTGEELGAALDALQRWTGPVDGLLSLNGSGDNVLLAMHAAATLGMHLVDGDACGRVFLRLEQTLLELAGVAATPLAIATPSGDVFTLTGPGADIERFVRPIVAESGGWAVCAAFPVDGATLRDTVVRGTVSWLVQEAVSGSRAARVASGARTLAHGVVTAIERPPLHRSGLVPAARSEGVSILFQEQSGAGRSLRIEARSELDLVLADGGYLAGAPDQLMFVDASDRVIDVDILATGMQLELIEVPVPAAWHEPAGLELARVTPAVLALRPQRRSRS